jgi:hypothetical protein
MKALKIVLYALAAIIFLAGLLSLLTVPFKLRDNSASYRAGYYLGRTIFFIISVILFLIARSIGKKMHKKTTQQMLDSLPR